MNNSLAWEMIPIVFYCKVNVQRSPLREARPFHGLGAFGPYPSILAFWHYDIMTTAGWAIARTPIQHN